MVARVFGIDRDNRQMREILALAKLLLRHAVRLVDSLLGKLVPEPMLVNGDQAEASRGEGIAKHGVDPRADPRRSACHFAQHEVAGFRVLQIANEQLAPLALVDR